MRIPRVSIHAFCDTPDAAAAMERAAGDRLMSRTQFAVRAGGFAAAFGHYQHSSTPNLVIIESRLPTDGVLAEVDRLATVCDPGTKLMVVGHANDIVLYRELMRRKVSEYMLAPVDPVSLISSVAGIYGESGPGKLGRVHAFIGAKGGVGSSTVAHNVGWAIGSRLGSSVVVADLDLPFGTAGLNFDQDPPQGIAEALQGADRLDGVLFDRLLTKCGEHLSLLSAPASLDKAYDLPESAFESLIEVAQSTVPSVILDVPHLWTAWARRTVVSADEVVIVAEPDLANLRNARNLLAVLRQARPNDPPPKLVLNRVGMPRREEIKPADFAKTLQIEPVACIPFDAALFASAANKGEVIASGPGRGPVPRAFAQVADAVTGRGDAKRNRKGGLGLGALFGRARSPSKGA